jgi:hypothetical protein
LGGLAVHRILFASTLLPLTCLIAPSSREILAADPPPDSVAAKITREHKLKAVISVDSTDGSGMMLREILDEIKSSVRDAKVDGKKVGTIRIQPDPKSGITLTTRIKFKSNKEPLEVVLDKMFEASGRPWGYYVNVSTDKTDQNDGALIIVNDPTCRGYPPGDPRNKKSTDKKPTDKKK